jgi:hypothetical protein
MPKVPRSPAGASRRSRTGQRRHKVTTRLSAQEKAVIGQAAARAGLAVGAWMGQAVMDAAENRALPVPAVHRALLAELAAASALLRQAAPLLADRGQAAGQAADACAQAARRADAAALRVARALAR